MLEGEEKRFLETLENGMDRLEEAMKAAKGGGGALLSGKDAFVLYDTFGFPLEMTVEMAGENGISVDTAEFEREMEKQRERGKQSWKSGEAGSEKILEALSADAVPASSGIRRECNEFTDCRSCGASGAVKSWMPAKGDSGDRECTFYGDPRAGWRPGGDHRLQWRGLQGGRH